MDKYCFIINPKSGLQKTTTKIVNYIEKSFSGLADFDVFFTKDKYHAQELVKQAIRQKFNKLILVGGDGTLNSILHCIVGKDISIGIIPRGSGNGFARGVGMPLHYKRAIKSIKNGEIKKIDCGKINGKYFINVAGIGFDAHIAKKFEQLGQIIRVRGPVPYFLLGINSYSHYRTNKLHITYKGSNRRNHSIDVSPFLITFSNGVEYGSGIKISPKADLSDGSLEMIILKDKNMLKNVKTTIDAFLGILKQSKDVKITKIVHAEVKSTKYPLHYHIDGEVFSTNKKARIDIMTKSIKLIVPKKGFLARLKEQILH